MATHSSILPWEIPWTEKLGGLQSMKSQSQAQLNNQTTTTLGVQNHHKYGGLNVKGGVISVHAHCHKGSESCYREELGN